MTTFNAVMAGEAKRLLFVNAEWERVNAASLNQSANDDDIIKRCFYLCVTQNTGDKKYVTEFAPVTYMSVKINKEE